MVFHFALEFVTKTPSSVLIVISGLLLYIIRWRISPKPIAGIPCNPGAAGSILGDIPSLLREIRTTREPFAWMRNQITKLNAPLVQVFIRPFGRPFVLLSDYQESCDLLMSRKQWDRADFFTDIAGGPFPNHHIMLKTNDIWRAHRKLLQDLMTPTFLNNVASPAIYKTILGTVKLLDMKSAIADEKPFSLELTIAQASLDGVLAFSFGIDFEYSATRAEINHLIAMDSKQKATIHDSSRNLDEPIDFGHAKQDEFIRLALKVASYGKYTAGSPVPWLSWKLVTWLMPSINRDLTLTKKYVKAEVKKAVGRLHDAPKNDSWIRCAVDHMISREQRMASDEDREPAFWTPVMFDEIFGFVTAGHESTSATLCWGFKYLIDNQEAQQKLRTALRVGHRAAVAEKRIPTAAEIANTHIPYLEACLEEIARCAVAVPFICRQANSDTELLGRRIPKGTTVFCIATGPGYFSPAYTIESKQQYSAPHNGSPQRRWKEDGTMHQFRPERWLVECPGNDWGLEFDSTAGPILSFGLGVRGCFGRRMTYIEMRMVVTMLFWHFEFLPCGPKLSSYAAHDMMAHWPTQCYARVRKVAC